MGKAAAKKKVNRIRRLSKSALSEQLSKLDLSKVRLSRMGLQLAVQNGNHDFKHNATFGALYATLGKYEREEDLARALVLMVNNYEVIVKALGETT